MAVDETARDEVIEVIDRSSRDVVDRSSRDVISRSSRDDVVEVVARIGDSILAIAHGSTVTVGPAAGANVFVPTPALTTFTASALTAPIVMRAGLVTIDVRRVPASADHVPRERPEWRAAAYIGLSLLLHLVLWGAAMEYRPAGLAERHRTQVLASIRPISEPAIPFDEPVRDVPMALEPGVLRGDMAGSASVDIVDLRAGTEQRETREHAIEAARNAGILGSGVLRGLPDGSDLTDAFVGAAVLARGEQDAGFGATRRMRRGCDGEDCGTVPTTGYGILCSDDGRCRAGTIGHGKGEPRRHEAAVPEVRICGLNPVTGKPCFVADGDLDKATIRRYIRRKYPAIVGCYEKQLLVDARLSGSLDTTFLIDPNGRVRDVRIVGISPEIETCVATVLESIQFPMARNGGTTQVHYPFEFHLAGS